MKRISKFSCIALATLALLTFSCKKESGVDAIVNAIDKATEQLDKASTQEERLKISQDLAGEMQKIQENSDTQDLTPEDQARIQEAMRQFVLKTISADTGNANVQQMIEQQSLESETSAAKED